MLVSKPHVCHRQEACFVELGGLRYFWNLKTLSIPTHLPWNAHALAEDSWGYTWMHAQITRGGGWPAQPC